MKMTIAPLPFAYRPKDKLSNGGLILSTRTVSMTESRRDHTVELEDPPHSVDKSAGKFL
jgi:hypothetical protein